MKSIKVFSITGSDTYELFFSDFSNLVKNLWDEEDASPGTELACSAIDAITQKFDHSTDKYVEPLTQKHTNIIRIFEAMLHQRRLKTSCFTLKL